MPFSELMLLTLRLFKLFWVGQKEIRCLYFLQQKPLFNMGNYKMKMCECKDHTQAKHTHAHILMSKQWIWEHKKWLSLVKLELTGQGKVINQANRAKPCYWLIYKTINFSLKIQIKILSALGNQCLQILIGLDIKCLT